MEISAYTPEILAYPYNLASPNPKERTETKDYLLCSLEVAAAIGTGRMLMTIPHPGYRVGKREARNLVLEPLRQICMRAEVLGGGSNAGNPVSFGEQRCNDG